MPTDKEIWGVPVAVSLAGRTNWPNEIKVIAVRKVLDDGERLVDIGQEIGAHENLIRKWCNQERRARGEAVIDPRCFLRGGVRGGVFCNRGGCSNR